MADLHSNLPESITPATFDALPDLPAIGELKSRRQWVSWKYENRGGSKPTKPPIAPRTGFGASHSKPETWGSYDEAVTRTQRSRLEGVGYVLSPDDGLTGADLDNCYDPQSGCIDAWAQAIIDLHETYAEFSPSGTGLRIIWRGKVEKAIKADAVNVEVYGTQRYLTITGWHLGGFTPKDIRPAPKTLALLQARVLAAKPVAPPTMLPARIEPASALPVPSGDRFFRDINTAALASLSTWVPSLYPSARLQPGTGAYRVSSKNLGRNLQEDLSISPEGIVDFGVADMGDAREGKRTPISIYMEVHGCDVKEAAFWFCQRMGRTPESFGWREPRTVTGREVISVDGILADAETGELIEIAPPDPTNEYPEELLSCGGLIDEIADWIMSTSMFPVRLFAVAAAIATVGTMIGRHVYTGLPRSGSGLYWLTIMPTGGGKDRPQQAIKQMLDAAGYGFLQKPAYASSAKLGISLAEKPVQIQIIDEVAKVFQKFVSRNSSSQEMDLLNDYCSVWGTNLGSFEPTGVTTRSDVKIKRPCLSFFGATTPLNFYDQLRSRQVSGGLLNRFIVLQKFNHVPEQKDLIPEETVPQHIVASLVKLRKFQDMMVGITTGPPSSVADMSTETPNMFVVPANAEATKMLEEYKAKTRPLLIKSAEDPIYEIWGRAAEMVKRMSLSLAASRHWDSMPSCDISSQDVQFSINLIDWAVGNFMNGLREHMSENEHQANLKLVVGLVRKVGKMTRTELYKKLDGRIDTRALNGIIEMALESHVIEALKEDAGPKGGPKKTIYVYKKGE